MIINTDARCMQLLNINAFRTILLFNNNEIFLMSNADIAGIMTPTRFK